MELERKVETRELGFRVKKYEPVEKAIKETLGKRALLVALGATYLYPYKTALERRRVKGKLSKRREKICDSKAERA